MSNISSLPMAYNSTAFEGNGSFNPDLAKIGSNITVDYDHYLARLDRLFLTALGEFVVVTGEPSDVPKKVQRLIMQLKLQKYLYQHLLQCRRNTNTISTT